MGTVSVPINFFQAVGLSPTGLYGRIVQRHATGSLKTAPHLLFSFFPLKRMDLYAPKKKSVYGFPFQETFY